MASRWPWLVVVALTVAGGGLVGAGFAAAPEPPPQPSDGYVPEPRPFDPTAPRMTPSEPVRVDAAPIDLRAPVRPVGLRPDGEVETPALDQAHLAGWYREGVTPGERGSAVLLGHVDSRRTGPAVFHRLGALRPGEQVEVTRRDGTVAVFGVDGVASYPGDRFPAAEVYGRDDGAYLRLVTCGGAFDAGRGHYTGNVVVFASLRGYRDVSDADRVRPLRTWIPDREDPAAPSRPPGQHLRTPDQAPP
ncbi:class F sortase [Longispora urticae]